MPSSRRPAEVAVTCEAVAEALPGIIDGTAIAELPVHRHVESCLRCQAEVATYRKMLRVLRQLRTDVLEPTPGLLADILIALESAGERRAVRDLLGGRRAAYVGGIAAATAAGAGAALVLASRARHRKLTLAS